MLTQEQTSNYLKVLGLDETPEVSKETLDDLIYRHQCTIPFSTMYAHRTDQSPSLDLQDLYKKVVEEGKGGYCFELNKLFEALLTSIGFDARPGYARTVRGRDERKPINHRAIFVELPEGTFFADVGFGGPMPSGALLVDDSGDKVIDGETFATTTEDGVWWNIERVTRASKDIYDDNKPEMRQVELCVCTSFADDLDFEPLNLFVSRPGMILHDNELLNLRTADGHKAYSNGTLTIRSNGEKTVIEIPEDQIDAAIEEYFGVKGI